MISKTAKQKAQYQLNRVDMLKKLKDNRHQLEEISVNGISSEDDHRIARIACSILASDYYYEEAMMADKTGVDDLTL